MKEKLEKILENRRGILILLFVLEIVLSIFITPNAYDDAWFIEQVTNELDSETNQVIEHTVIDFVKDRYSSWSSRVLIEFTLCSVLKISKYLWIFLEALMVTLACYSISRIFMKENNRQNNLMLMAMVLIYPYTTMHQTGWASTTINYMWPLAMCLFALIPIKKMWDNEKIKFWEYPLYTLALIYAGNQEQSCAILVGFYLIFTIIITVRDKKVKPYMILQLILAIASIVFILTCPGNYVRQEDEMRRFVDFEMLTVLDKFVLGFTSTFGQIIANQDLIYTLFMTLLVIYIFSNYKEKLYRAVALFPLLSMLALGHFSVLTFSIFPEFETFYDLITTEDTLLTVANCNDFYYVIPVLFIFANFICIVMSLLLLTKKYSQNLPLLIYLAGIASKIIIAFSPTVFVSKTRTMIFLDFAMIIISYMIWQRLDKKNKKINLLTTCIYIAAGMQYANTLIYIYSNKKLF